MPEEKKHDPFKPQTPSIPGVPAKPAALQQTKQQKFESAPLPPQGSPFAAVGIVAGVIIVFVVIGMLSFRSLVSSVRSKHNASADSADIAPSVAPAAALKPADPMLTGPGPIATTAELTKPWSSRKFLFRGHVAIDPQPAMVVKLPGGQYWAFSLQEPFGTCALDYVADLDKLQSDYGFHATHPMVVDTCTKTVYDLSQYSAGSSDGALVRGAIVQGNGIRPPMAIEVEVQGKQIVAVRGE